MKKTLSTILLIGALGFGLGMNGCNKEEQEYSNKQVEPSPVPIKGYGLNKSETVPEFYGSGYYL